MRVEENGVSLGNGGSGGSARGFGRFGRIALRVLVWVIGLPLAIVLVVLVLFLLAPVRRAVLVRALPKVTVSLPGRITIGGQAWPAPGTIELRDVLWMDQGDTLLSAGQVRVSLDLGALARRDLHLYDLALVRVRADLPVIRRSFPPKPPQPKKQSSFPREGSVPKVPSVALEHLLLDVPAIRLPDSSRVVGLLATGNLDLRRGRPPLVRLERFSAHSPERGWGVDSARFEIAPGEGRVSARAVGNLIPGQPFFLAITPTGPDAFTVLLVPQAGGRPPQAIGALLDAKVSLRGAKLETAEVSGVLKTPGTVDLARLPGMKQKLANLPDLEGLALEMRGAVRLSPERAGSVSLRFLPNKWCDGGKLDAALLSDGARLDTFRLALPDLALELRGAMVGDSVRGQAGVRVRGARWLQILRPEAKLPDSLRADIDAFVDGTRPKPAGNLLVRARARIEKTATDTVRIEAHVPNGWKDPAEARIIARAYDVLTVADVAAVLKQPIELRVAPIRVFETGAPPAGPAPDLTGTVRIPAKNEDLVLQNVRMEGSLGNLLVDANISRTHDGSFRLTWEWPDAPGPLVARMRMRGGAADTLRNAWAADGPFRIAFSGTTGPVTGGIPVVNANGRYDLPGPGTLSVFMPKAQVSDLGPIRGSGTVRTTRTATGPDLHAELDLDSTAWVDTGRVAIRLIAKNLTLDTLQLAVAGLRAAIHAARADSNLLVRGSLHIPDARFAGRFVPSLRNSYGFHVDANGSIHGNRTRPDGAVEFTAAAVGPKINLPEAAGRLELMSGQMAVHLGAPKGAALGTMQFDTLGASYFAQAAAIFPGLLELHAHGPDIEFANRVRIARAQGFDLAVDTLGLRLGKQDLLSRGPFTIHAAGPDSTLIVRGLDLEGSMGTLRADGSLSPGGSDFRATMRLSNPKRTATATRLPTESLPDAITLDLTARGRTLTAVADATGVPVEKVRPMDVHLSLTGDGSFADADLTVRSRDSTVARGTFRIPAVLQAYPPRGLLRDGPVTMDAGFSRFPLPLQHAGAETKESSGEPAELDGALRMRGQARHPSANFEGRISFPGWKKLDAYALQISAIAQPENGLDPAVQGAVPPNSLLRTQQIPPPRPAGVSAALALFRKNASVLNGTLVYPVTWSLIPPAFPKGPAGTMDLRIESQEIVLEDFTELLPPNTGLDGTAQFRLTASGPPTDPRLDGQVRSSSFALSLPDGTRLDAEANLRFAGTALAPTAVGTITVHHGVLVVPSTPPNLLPAQGPSLLRHLAREERAGRDSIMIVGLPGQSAQQEPATRAGGPGSEGAPEDTTGSVAPAQSRGTGASAALGTPRPGTANPDTSGQARRRRRAAQIRPSYDVRIVIPGGLMVQGQGLNIELAGELHVEQQGEKPTMAGELTAPRGTFNFLGRDFQVQSGTVVFFGRDEINPTLDLTLVNTIEQTQIQIHLQGTAQVPELSLTSTPEMSEGDIMSLIVFGVPLNSLDTAQMNLLQDRASQVAESYATTQLTARLSRQLGIDILSIQKTAGPEPQSALVVGKYLSPKVLLKYQQVLAQGGNILVNLDYFLTRHWKVESSIGWQTQSGLNVYWTDEY